MDIFIGNLPPEAKISDLQDFLGNVDLYSSLEYKKGVCNQSKNYFYIIARTDSTTQGLSLIEKIHHEYFYGRHLDIREHIERDNKMLDPYWIENDRRINAA